MIAPEGRTREELMVDWFKLKQENESLRREIRAVKGNLEMVKGQLKRRRDMLSSTEKALVDIVETTKDIYYNWTQEGN